MNRKALFSVGFLGAGLFLALPFVYAAELTKEDEKKAAAAASNAADQWAASQKEPEKVAPAAETPKPADTPAAPEQAAQPVEVHKPVESQKPVQQATKPVAPKPNLNEMTGKIISIEDDPRIIRVALDGGYNIEFTYDNTTVFVNGGSPIKPKDLYYGDKVQVFYAGKNLNAVEIERLEKAPRPFAE